MLTPFPARAQEPSPSPSPTAVVDPQAAAAEAATPAAAGHLVYLRANIDQDYAFGHIGGGVTVHDDGPHSFSLWADAYTAMANDEDDEDFEAGSLGAAYRRRLSADASWGAHSFLDFGSDDAFGDTLAQVSVGGDYLKALEGEADPSVRIGGNFYVPLDDYTNIENFGVLSSAPQFGADAFAEYGRDITDTGLRLDLTAGAFDYTGGEDAENLWGGFSSAGLTFARGATGFAASAEVGLRYASGGDGLFNEEERVTPFLGLELSYSWGGRRSSTRRIVTEATSFDPPRDCVIARDGAGAAYYDCTRPVMAGDAAAAGKEGVVRESLPLPPPTVEERTLTRAGVRPVAPMRHLGFNTAFAPVRRPDGFDPSPPPPPPSPPESPPPSPPPPTSSPPSPPPSPPASPPPSPPPPTSPPESPPPSPPASPPPSPPPPTSPPESPPPSPPASPPPSPPPPTSPPESPPPSPPASPPPSPPPPPYPPHDPYCKKPGHGHPYPGDGGHHDDDDDDDGGYDHDDDDDDYGHGDDDDGYDWGDDDWDDDDHSGHDDDDDDHDWDDHDWDDDYGHGDDDDGHDWDDDDHDWGDEDDDDHNWSWGGGEKDGHKSGWSWGGGWGNWGGDD